MRHTSHADPRRDAPRAFAGRLALGRWVPVLLAYTLAPLFVAAAYARPPRVAFWWDACMALGALGTGGIALLPLLSPRWWVPEQRGAAFLRHLQQLHRVLSYGLIALVLLHGIGLLVLEPRTIDYLLLSAPGYMLCGIAAALLIAVLTCTSIYRHALGFTHTGWRHWHAGLSAATLGCVAWHLAGSAYYYASLGKVVGLAVLTGAPTLATLHLRHRHAPHPPAPHREVRHAGTRRRVDGRAVEVVSVMLAAWLAAAAIYAGTTPPPRPPSGTAPCAEVGSSCP